MSRKYMLCECPLVLREDTDGNEETDCCAFVLGIGLLVLHVARVLMFDEDVLGG